MVQATHAAVAGLLWRLMAVTTAWISPGLNAAETSSLTSTGADSLSLPCVIYLRFTYTKTITPHATCNEKNEVKYLTIGIYCMYVNTFSILNTLVQARQSV